jgi:hypothetical protein
MVESDVMRSYLRARPRARPALSKPWQQLLRRITSAWSFVQRDAMPQYRADATRHDRH